MTHFLRLRFAIAVLAVCVLWQSTLLAAPQSVAAENAPVVSKVEPPNWWVRLTPDLMILLSGHALQANKVTCNLPEVVVERTQATQGGDYLFVWIFAFNMRSAPSCAASQLSMEKLLLNYRFQIANQQLSVFTD
jgi:hypothetical protein